MHRLASIFRIRVVNFIFALHVVNILQILKYFFFSFSHAGENHQSKSVMWQFKEIKANFRNAVFVKLILT